MNFSNTGGQAKSGDQHHSAPVSKSIEANTELKSNTVAEFLKCHTPYDLLPISFKVILLDNRLPVKKALGALIHNGINYAPLWDSELQQYGGLLTSNDFISLVEYYYGKANNQEAIDDLDQLQICQVQELEKSMGIYPPGPTKHAYVRPFDTLYEASQRILAANSHTIPVLDTDPSTNQPSVVTVLTQYRILKFVAVNFKAKSSLNKTLKEIGIGTYGPLATARLDAPVIELVHKFMARRVAAVPIVDEEGTVLNVFENNDVLALLREGDFSALDRPISETIRTRSESFEGVHRCQTSDTLRSILDTIKKEMVSRIVVVDAQDRLEGILTLSDILSYFLNE
ncbi:AMP-activated serine/threonine-protein kinase regulatory subunit [Entomophthora muscae]|uniref:AMP-activated serine/threonine-protein kinase regulatory subunit n=1 Tax=Entomophthora muscae TaxID=34485 RepID=A0ACC2RGL1_9FUNG|nr:AMP-activated serine/threonine-protein kinase regulatory subunit [Entomophthora muscae]